MTHRAVHRRAGMDALMPTPHRPRAGALRWSTSRADARDGREQKVKRWRPLLRPVPTRNVTGRFFLDSAPLAAGGAVEGDKLG